MNFIKNMISLLFNKEAKIKSNEFLKQVGTCMMVEPAKIEIFSTIKYADEVENNASHQVQMLDGLIGRNTEDTKGLNVCYLVYSYENNGEKVKMVSPPIYKDRITILYLLEHEKKVSIYMDTTDKNNYYFDLKFIN